MVSPGVGAALTEAAVAGAGLGVPLLAESTATGAAGAPLVAAAFAASGVRPVGVLGASDDLGMSPAQARAERSRSTAGVCLDGRMEGFTWAQGCRRQKHDPCSPLHSEDGAGGSGATTSARACRFPVPLA